MTRPIPVITTRKTCDRKPNVSLACAPTAVLRRYCGSFPKLFDAVDTYCTDEKYSEVDTKKLKTEE